MTAILRPQTPGTVFKDIENRLRALESQAPTNVPAGATMTELCSTGALGLLGTFAFTSTQALVPGSNSPSFTLHAPTTILVSGSMVHVTNGGTANYGLGALILTASGWTPGSEVVSSSTVRHTNASGVSDSSRIAVAAAVPAGTYSGWWT